MSWTDVVTAIGTVAGGGAIGIVGSVFTFTANRRSQYDRVLEETGKLTSGSIAEDRNLIGKALEGGTVSLTDQEIQAFFNVLWMFERLNGLYVSHAPTWPLGHRQNRPQILLLESVRGGIGTWYEYSTKELCTSAGDRIDYGGAAIGLIHLYHELERLP